MPTLYLSEPHRCSKAGTDLLPQDCPASYRRAVEGLLTLCAEKGWSCYRSGMVEAYDDISHALLDCPVFVAVRAPGMLSATQLNWELASSVRAPGPVKSRELFVFKLAPTAEFDDFWEGHSACTEIDGDAEALLVAVSAAMQKYAAPVLR